MTRTVAAQPSLARQAAAGAGWIVAWRVATRNVGLVSTLILVRLLDPSDFGLVALATGLINSVDALSAIGVQDALVRAPSPTRDMYNTGFGLSVLRGVLTAVIVAAMAWPVGEFMNDSRLAIVMLALAAGLLISSFENIGIVDFRRDMAFRKEFDMQLWSRVGGVAATIAVAAIWRSYWALVVGILVYRILRLLQSYTMSPFRPRFTLRAWRHLIGFSLWTWAQTMLFQIRERSDNIVIGRVLGAAQVGMFSVGTELGTLPSTEIAEPLNRALFSGFASLHAASKGLGDMFLGAIGLGFLLILPAGLGISMIADPMVRLTLGQHWIPAVPVVQIIAVMATLTMFGSSSATLLNAIGRPSQTFYLVAISGAVRLAGLILWVPSYGLTGAAIALSVAALVDLVAFLWVTLPQIGVSLRQVIGRSIRPCMATGVMVLALWQLGMAWTPSAGTEVVQIGIDVAMRSSIGATCYGLALALCWFAAGRPDGAERHALMLAGGAWSRIRGLLRI